MSLRKTKMASLPTKLLALVYICTLIDLCPCDCSAGAFLSENNACQPCPEGSYMDAPNHRNSQCQRCTDETYQHTFVRYPCNSTHDTDYACDAGRFNSNGIPPNCLVCRDCELNGKFEAQPCSQTDDAICCPKPDMTLADAVDNACVNSNSTDTRFCCMEKAGHQNTAPSSRTSDKSTVTMPTTTEVLHPKVTSILVDEASIKVTQSQSGLDVGAINGIASVVVIIGIAIVAVLYCKKQRKKWRKSKGAKFEMINTGEDEDIFPRTNTIECK